MHKFKNENNVQRGALKLVAEINIMENYFCMWQPRKQCTDKGETFNT